MSKKKTNEEFKKEVYDLVENEYTFLEKYINANTKIECIHNECGHKWKIRPDCFLRGQRCPKCKGKRISKSRTKTHEQFEKEFYNLIGNEYELLSKYKKAQIKIKVKHNVCGYEYEVTPNHFLDGNRCPKCNRPNYNRDDKQFKQQMYELVGDEYTFLGKYVSTATKIKVRHNICGCEWEVKPNNFITGTRCPNCFGKKKKTTKYFKKEVFEIVGNEYTVLNNYKNIKTKVKFKHNKCGYEFEMLPGNFLCGQRCPRCMRKLSDMNTRKTNKEFIQEVYELVGNEYEFLEKYISNKTKIKVKHNICNYIYEVAPICFLRGARCPQCAESKGETIIRNYLENNNIDFKKEYSFENLKGIGNGLLRFDFAVFQNDKLRHLIEYDGEFHYKNFYEDGSFETLQIHDKRKNQYCKNNNIPLLRIPYWEFDSIEEILDNNIMIYY